MSEKTPWYNEFGGRYTGDQPFFYKREDLPWVKIFEDNWQIMRDEMTALVNAKPERLRPYFINPAMSFPPRHWKTMGLYFWKYTMHGNCRECPKTVKILKSIPGLTSFSLSVLEAGSNINPHQGDTDAIYRCHIGISIPADLPDCGFQVGTEIRGWKEGEALPFCDAHTHTAWNNTKERRLVLIADVVRPEYLDRQNSICAHVLASSILQMLYERSVFLGRRSGYIKKALYMIFKFLIRCVLPFQNAATV